jgi:type IV pilus assembly protein PilE
MNTKSFSKGFTLVELMIVVAVIAILAAVAIPAYHNHILRVRQSEAHNSLLDIKASQEMFYAQYNTYGGWPADGGTFSSLLSFSISDSTYYVFSTSSTAGGDDFFALAQGKNGTKFENNEIRILDSESDPVETVEPVGFKFSLMFQ